MERIETSGPGKLNDARVITARSHVTEGATSNVFAVFGRTLVTPPADGQILDGITRSRC